MVFNLKIINILLSISACTVFFTAQASFQPLLGSDLNNQSLYASGYIAMGARTTVGGNVQSADAITLGADAIVGGNIEAGTAVTLGATAGVNGYIQAGSTATLGAGTTVQDSIQAGTTMTLGASVNVAGDLVASTTVTIGASTEIGGDVLAGTTVTVGASSIFHGNVDAGTTTTIGADVQIDGDLTANSSLVPPPSPVVKNQEDLITSVQTTIKDLGTGTELVSTTFGVNDETLESGIYSTINYLTIAIGKTLTLDGKGVDGTWVFNISNYLSFAADSKVILKNVTDNSSIIWNVLGDKPGAAGYTQLGAGAEARGYIFAKGFVQTGANAMIAGIGNDCGGAYSATNFVEFGADSVIGVEGCTNGNVTSANGNVTSATVPEPASIWLLGLGFLGLIVMSRRNKT
ncbi:MAG: putative acyltransferase (DUF342 family) [Cognaticolwellia sp.]|jgi:predicted acyltransferase (DUF342 family)